MGLNVRRKILLRETTIMICSHCKLAYDANTNFCPSCGKKLSKKSSKVYVNIGKHGITSLSYKTADGITINSKGNTTIPIGKGISYTITSKKN